MLRMGKAPWTGARDQYMVVAGAMGTSSLWGSRGVVRMRGSRGLRAFFPSFAEGDDGRRLMDWADSTGGALETWRSDDGFRVAAMRGVPGAVGVGVEDEEAGCAGAGGCWGLLKVEVDAVAWWVGWRYGERDWTGRVWRSSFVETLLIVSSSSLFDSAELVCFRNRTRLAIARGDGDGCGKMQLTPFCWDALSRGDYIMFAAAHLTQDSV